MFSNKTIEVSSSDVNPFQFRKFWTLGLTPQSFSIGTGFEDFPVSLLVPGVA